MEPLKIAIIGTRGIPNCYGGFEQLAQYLAAGMVQNGFDVTVYNSHKHPYQYKEWNGVKIVHCHDPEHRWGTAGQFIYDFNCLADARKRKFDVVLLMGYTSCSICSVCIKIISCYALEIKNYFIIIVLLR